MATYDHAYRVTARMLQELYRYVSMTELAKRVRPSRNHQRQPSPPIEGDAPRLLTLVPAEPEDTSPTNPLPAA